MATRWIVAVAFVLVLTSCTPSVPSASPTEVDDSQTLTIALELEPPDLHVDRPTNGLLVTAWIREALLDSLFGVSKNLEYTPELLATEPTVTTNGDDTVTIEYLLRSSLSWSDGKPLTSEDVAYTFERLIEGCAKDPDGSIVDAAGVDDGCVFERRDRSGVDLITDFQVKNETEFSVTLASQYAGWKSLFGPIFAKHAYGETSAELNENLLEMTGPDGVLPSSGPMTFGGWARGRAIVLARNENYHGSTSPDARNQGVAYVSNIEIVFSSDLDSQVSGVLAGEIDVVMASPDETLDRLGNSSSFVLAAEPGPKFEHWALNVLNPHLANPEVREAIAYGIDKEQVVSVLYEPLFGNRIDPEGLGNSFWMSNQPGYINHQSKYETANVSEAERSLEEVGYEKQEDGFYSHPELGRLSLRVTTPPGNRLRQLQIELIASQLEKAGIEIVIEPGPQNFFAETIASEQALLAASTQGAEGDPTVWDIAQFSWTSGPWPGNIGTIYRTGGQQNIYGFANDEYDRLLNECNAEIDTAAQVICYNELDTFATTLDQGPDGLFSIPITQQPSYFGYNSEFVSTVPIVSDSVAGGPLANAADYQLVE